MTAIRDKTNTNYRKHSLSSYMLLYALSHLILTTQTWRYVFLLSIPSEQLKNSRLPCSVICPRSHSLLCPFSPPHLPKSGRGRIQTQVFPIPKLEPSDSFKCYLVAAKQKEKKHCHIFIRTPTMSQDLGTILPYTWTLKISLWLQAIPFYSWTNQDFWELNRFVWDLIATCDEIPDSK